MTPNKEDYLKCIYELSIQRRKVNNKLIAQVMNVSAPAVTEMLKKLLQSGTVFKDVEQGFALTQEGKLVVSEVIRKHRLLEVFLLNVLSYDYQQVHKEAEVLEHAVSDYFIDQLDAFLNYPRTCPHGSVIPKKGELLQDVALPLTMGQIGESYRIYRLYNDQRLLEYLQELKISVGDTLKIIDMHEFAQTITLQTDKKNDIVMSLSIAQQILVEPTSV